jgi:hypothetical protein
MGLYVFFTENKKKRNQTALLVRAAAANAAHLLPWRRKIDVIEYRKEKKAGACCLQLLYIEEAF